MKVPLISYVMGTYNRPGYLERSMLFNRSSSAPFLILDASEKSQEEMVRRMGPPGVQYFHMPGKSAYDRVRIAMEEVTTPYALFVPDDDFFIEPSVMACVDFLEKNPAYASAQGHYLRFKEKGPKIDYILSYTNSFGKDHCDPDTSIRLSRYFVDFHGLYYAVQRTDVLRAFSRRIPVFKSYTLAELTHAYFLILKGFHKVLELPYCLRELFEKSAGATSINYSQLKTDPVYADDMTLFLKTLIEWTGEMGVRNPGKTVVETFDRYAEFGTALFKTLNPFVKIFSTFWPKGAPAPVREYPVAKVASVFDGTEMIKVLESIERFILGKYASSSILPPVVWKEEPVFLSGRHTVAEFIRAYAISRERKLVTNEIHVQNDYYGHAFQMKRFAGMDPAKPLKFAMEHAPFFFDHPVWKIDKKAPFNLLGVYSSDRIAQIQRETGKISFPFGPFIHYSMDLLDSEAFAVEKRRLGRNLLVYPSHSTHHVQIIPDIERLRETIRKREAEFDTIRFCVYWADLESAWCRQLEQDGYEIVTAGHMYDPWFNSRQKHLIELSDMVASNSAATHMGYAILLGRPVWYIPTEETLCLPRGKDVGATDEIYSRALRRYRWLLKRAVRLEEFSEKISRDEYSAYAGFHGFSSLRSPAFIKEFLGLMETLDAMGFNREKAPLNFLTRVADSGAVPSQTCQSILQEMIEVNRRADSLLEERLREWGHPDDGEGNGEGKPCPPTIVDIMELMAREMYAECLAACDENLRTGPNPDVEQCRRLCLVKIAEKAG